MALDDLIREHRKELDQLEESARLALVEPYLAAQASILADLDRLAEEGKEDTFTAEHLRLTLEQVEDHLRTMEVIQSERFMGEFHAALQLGAGHTISEIVELEATFGSVEVAASVRTVAPVIPAGQVARIADPARLLLTEHRGAIFEDVSSELAQSVIRGEGVAAAARRLRDSEALDGELWQLERIARTEINNAANVGHEATIGQVAETYPDLGLKKQWSTKIDGRESDICRALNRQIRAAGEAFSTEGIDGVPLWTGMHPPAHPNCRSRVIPYSQRWADRGLIKGNIIDFHAYRRAAYDAWGGCGDGCDHEEGLMLKRNGKVGERKALAFTGFKMIDAEAGTFEGYAAAFGNVDSHGDIVQKGAFAKTIASWRTSQKMIPILWQHDPENPIGVCDSASLEEDDHGLKVKGKLVLGVQKADEARLLMQSGALGGLSIGYDVFPGGKKAPPKGSGAKRLLTDIDLWEWSPVTWPSNGQAEIGEVKSADGTKAADFSTMLDINQRRDGLWRRKWDIQDALCSANDQVIHDEALTREQKIAAITGNLTQYSIAMIAWYGELLTLHELEAAAGLKASVGPEETKDGGPEALKVGRTISAATQKQIEDAVAAVETAAGKLRTLIAPPAPADDAGAGGAGEQPKGAGPAPTTTANGQQAGKSAIADALDTMRVADAVARMKAAV